MVTRLAAIVAIAILAPACSDANFFGKKSRGGDQPAQVQQEGETAQQPEEQAQNQDQTAQTPSQPQDETQAADETQAPNEGTQSAVGGDTSSNGGDSRDETPKSDVENDDTDDHSTVKPCDKKKTCSKCTKCNSCNSYDKKPCGYDKKPCNSCGGYDKPCNSCGGYDKPCKSCGYDKPCDRKCPIDDRDDADDFDDADDYDDADDRDDNDDDYDFCFEDITKINPLLQISKIPEWSHCKITSVKKEDFVIEVTPEYMTFNYARALRISKDITITFDASCDAKILTAHIFVPIVGVCADAPKHPKLGNFEFPEHLVAAEVAEAKAKAEEAAKQAAAAKKLADKVDTDAAKKAAEEAAKEEADKRDADVEEVKEVAKGIADEAEYLNAKGEVEGKSDVEGNVRGKVTSTQVGIEVFKKEVEAKAGVHGKVHVKVPADNGGIATPVEPGPINDIVVDAPGGTTPVPNR